MAIIELAIMYKDFLINDQRRMLHNLRSRNATWDLSLPECLVLSPTNAVTFAVTPHAFSNDYSQIDVHQSSTFLDHFALVSQHAVSSVALQSAIFNITVPIHANQM
jgi:hypothetical protein